MWEGREGARGGTWGGARGQRVGRDTPLPAGGRSVALSPALSRSTLSGSQGAELPPITEVGVIFSHVNELHAHPRTTMSNQHRVRGKLYSLAYSL